MDRMNNIGSLTDAVLNWTAGDPINEIKNNLYNLRAELNRLCDDEEAKRKNHIHSKGSLQEAWDKLLQLRSHISWFRTVIDEVTLEEVSLRAEQDSLKSIEPSLINGNGTIPLTVDSAIRLGSLNDMRENIRLKEGLKRKLALLDDLLDGIRFQLAENSKVLIRMNDSVDPLNNESLSSSMAVRHNILTLSQQLSNAEEEYSSSENELERIEHYLSRELEKVRSTDFDYIATHSSSDVHNLHSVDQQQQQMSNENLATIVEAVLQGKDDHTSIQTLNFGEKGNKSKVNVTLSKPIRCEFSLHEVLSGHARVIRLNGEDPKVYRGRLEKRLSVLVILDKQLQQELLAKTEDVRRDRDRVSKYRLIFITNYKHV